MITKRIQKIGNSKGIIFSPEMRQHLGEPDVVEVVYLADGILIKKPMSVADAGARAMSKYPKTLKKLAQ